MNCRQMRLQMLKICGFVACVFAGNFAFAAAAFAADCGGEGQRECNVWENFPSCKDGRIAFKGNCYTKNDCGKENQRACTIGERVPSCDPNLIELKLKGTCVGRK